MELRLVKTRPVPEHAGFFAETFAVIRGDDHPGPLENRTAIELVDQPAELLIEVRDAVVVSSREPKLTWCGEGRFWISSSQSRARLTRDGCAA